MKLIINLVGRVGQHKTVKVEGKPPFVDFHVATELQSPNGKEYTNWTHVKAWHEQAQCLMPKIRNGCMVSVSGRPEVKAYSRRDGSPAADLVVHADEVVILSDGAPEKSPATDA